MNTIISNNAPLLSEKFTTPTINDYLDSINLNIKKSNKNHDLATNITELEDFIESKKPILNKYFEINLTKNKQNKAKDFISDFFFNTTDGYQELKSRWDNCYVNVIAALEKAKTMPEKVFFATDLDEDYACLINNKVNIVYHRSDWQFDYFLNDLGNSKNWLKPTSTDFDLLKNAYFVAQMIVEENSNGTEFYYENIDYIKKLFNFSFTGTSHKDVKYYKNQDGLIVLMLVRPSIEEIDKIIIELKKIIK